MQSPGSIINVYGSVVEFDEAVKRLISDLQFTRDQRNEYGKKLRDQLDKINTNMSDLRQLNVRAKRFIVDMYL